MTSIIIFLVILALLVIVTTVYSKRQEALDNTCIDSKTYTPVTKMHSSIISFYDFSYKDKGIDSSGNTLNAVATAITNDCTDDGGVFSGVSKLDVDLSKVGSIKAINLSFNILTPGESILVKLPYISITISPSNIIRIGDVDVFAVNAGALYNMTININDNTTTVYLNETPYNTAIVAPKITNVTIGNKFKGVVSNVIFFNENITLELVSKLARGDYGYDVYHLAGQSNMLGRAQIVKGIDDNYSLIKDKVFEFPFDINNNQKIEADGSIWETDLVGSIIKPARNPLDHITSLVNPRYTRGGLTEIDRSDSKNSTGLWKTFSEDIIKVTPSSRKILIVSGAKSGAGFSTGALNRGDPIYNASVKLLNKALETHPLNRLCAILWHQGETDANLDFYDTLLNRTLADFKLDIPQYNDTVPFILAGIGSLSAKKIDGKASNKPDAPVGNSDSRDNINNLMKKFIKGGDNRYYVDIDDLKLIRVIPEWDGDKSGDKWRDDTSHFNTESVRLLGKRYAIQYIKSLTNPNKRAISDPVGVMYIPNKLTDWEIKSTCKDGKQDFTRRCTDINKPCYGGLTISKYC